MSGAVYKDKGLNALIGRLINAADLELRVGFVGEKAKEISSGGRLTIGEVALINELGSRDGHIPRREPLQATMRDNASEIKKLIVGAAHSLLADNSAAAAETALAEVGARIVSMVQRTINEMPQDNAPSTVRHKGFNAPLVDH
jgi:hypothetical protein